MGKKKASVGTEKSEDSGGLEGNTELPTPAPKKKQPNRRKYWAFTFFNYLGIEGSIKTWLEFNCIKALVGEETCPTTGNKHLQGFFELKYPKRLTEIQNKPLTWSKLAPCFAGEEANTKYCSKDGNIWFQHPRPREPLKIIKELRPFQSQLEKLLLQERDDRSIIWICDPSGCKGKSSLCRYLIYHYEALYLTEGKKSDLINIVYNYVVNKDLKIVLVDVPKSNKNISYKTLEEIKNGIICNTKYETGTQLINPPHIVVFANFYPDTEQFITDRWVIYGIDDEYNLTNI